MSTIPEPSIIYPYRQNGVANLVFYYRDNMGILRQMVLEESEAAAEIKADMLRKNPNLPDSELKKRLPNSIENPAIYPVY